MATDAKENGKDAAAADAGCDARHEGRDECFMDVDRMINEGLGGGQVTLHNGMIGDSTTDTMEQETKD